MNRPRRLVGRPVIPPDIARQLQRDFDRFAEGGLPSELEGYLLEAYRLDVSTCYAGLPIKNPWGKASGQLSMRPEQVADDAAAGLGFVVLKTVVAQDAAGAQAMKDWALRESHMVAARIRGQCGAEGWTINWKGRGWWESLEKYLDLVRAARALAAPAGMLVVPSCKFHLPTPAETRWRVEEYRYTLQRLLEAYHDRAAVDVTTLPSLPPMPLEKDFSPTLAGSHRAAVQAKVLEWLKTVPRLIRQTASLPVRIGLKLFNALFDDSFQVEMLRCLHEVGPDRPDFVVYCNRLFDPHREFEGHRGIAYGGPDLSDRNLRVLDAFLNDICAGRVASPVLEISATGDICSGRMAMEYALRGSASFQLHTFFQLPVDQYVMRKGNKTQKALHLLYFQPEEGLVAWIHHWAGQMGVGLEGPIRFRDIAVAQQ